jgi:ribonuclease E
VEVPPAEAAEAVEAQAPEAKPKRKPRAKKAAADETPVETPPEPAVANDANGDDADENGEPPRGGWWQRTFG